MLRLLLLLLPLGLDTFGISVSLGIKSHRAQAGEEKLRSRVLPAWLYPAFLFSFAETIMPLVGLAIGYAASLLISSYMHILGSLLLIAVGAWELLEELRERHSRGKTGGGKPLQTAHIGKTSAPFLWGQQLLLALSVSLDELAIGFSFGTITAALPKGASISPVILCIYIGLQGLLMAITGITLGRLLSNRLRMVKEWSELLSAVLLIGLGIWLLIA